MPVTPLPAATLVLLRDGVAGLEVLMLERHRDAFFSGALVFPGGRVDDQDHDLARAYPAPGLAEDALAFRIAAIRESWEEAGILLARRRGEDRIVPAAAGRGRTRRFAELLAEEAMVPAADHLVPFAHWVTPEDSPRRYDTLFFLARGSADHAPVPDGGEAVDAAWFTPAAAIAEADAKRRRLIFATRVNLLRLMRSGTVSAALEAARRQPIVRICPELYQAPDGPHLRIPEGVGYDVFDLPAAERRHY
jgi:8-oxo-dGTP pyrophosphatase MutT (NUDIX family)